MNQSRVDVHIVVYNGEKYLRHCLRAVRAQTYPHVRVRILDNASSDATLRILSNEFPEYEVVRSQTNVGMWPGQERLLAESDAQYILALSVDVILDPLFIQEAVTAADEDKNIAGIQGKIYRYDTLDSLRTAGSHVESRDTDAPRVIDTCGFRIDRGRRVFNIGHGEVDSGQFHTLREIFGVEGAVPFFRRLALEDSRVDGHIADPDYFWYGDDLDLAWRIHLLGWKQIFVPSAIAYHDRSTTKAHSRGPFDAITRRHTRTSIPLFKRKLDWANVRCTIVKNDFIMNVLKDSPWILWRELMVAGYTLLFEPTVLGALPRFLRLLPRMLGRRRSTMRRARVSADAMHRWFV